MGCGNNLEDIFGKIDHNLKIGDGFEALLILLGTSKQELTKEDIKCIDWGVGYLDKVKHTIQCGEFPSFFSLEADKGITKEEFRNVVEYSQEKKIDEIILMDEMDEMQKKLNQVKSLSNRENIHEVFGFFSYMFKRTIRRINTYCDKI